MRTASTPLAAIARRLLAAAPPRFALVGLSMGGYISFEIMRQAPERVAKLALLDTGARAETPEQTKARLPRIELAKRGRMAEVAREAIVIDSTHYGRVEDAQMGICHMLCYAFMEHPEWA